MKFTCITKYPIGCVPDGEENSFVPAYEAQHPDKGFIAVQRADSGKYRYVDNDGNVEDDRSNPGAGERFIPGQSGTVIAFRPDGNLTGTPYVFPVQ